MYRFQSLLVLSILLFIISCNNYQSEMGKTEMLKKQIAQFSKTELTFDSNLLDERQKIVVEKLYLAAKVMDDIFLEQVYSKNNEIRSKLATSGLEEDKLLLEYFDLMVGPFDRLNHDKPFYGTESKPLGANYYPEDMTKEERGWKFYDNSVFLVKTF